MFEKLEKHVRGLCEAFADKTASAMDDEAAFNSAVMHGKTGIVRRHLDAGRDVNKRAGNYPPAYLAAMFGYSETAMFLLTRGADPNARTPGGDTALHIAASKNDTALIRALFRAGADPSLRNARRETALEMAFVSSKEDAFAQLVACGADPDQKMSNNCRIRDYGPVLPRIEGAIIKGTAMKNTNRLKNLHKNKRRKGGKHEQPETSRPRPPGH